MRKIKRAYLRLYDEDTIGKIKIIAKTMNKSFPQVCAQLCCENVDEMYAREVEKIDSSEVLVENLDTTMREIGHEVLGGMKDVKIYSQIQTKLLSVIYNVILQMSDGEHVDSVAIDGGMFDELPERFSDMLDLLIIQRNGQA